MFIGNALREGPPDQLRYATSGIDPRAVEPDQLVDALRPHARGWKFDAAWWSMELRGVSADGTVDLTSGGRASIVFLSPSRVGSLTKKRRMDALRRYRFGARTIQASGRIGVQRRWRNIYLPPKPTCTVVKLVRALAKRGLIGSRRVRITFDPNLAYGPQAPSELSWLVRGDIGQLEGWFSMTTCRLTKRLLAPPAKRPPPSTADNRNGA